MGLFQFLHSRKPKGEPAKIGPHPIAQDKLKAVMYGLAIGDALGVPYEFHQRDTFTCAGMTGHGTHNQPAGTWSDDTAMSLATLDSLNECGGKVDTTDLMMRYKMWLKHGRYMPDGGRYTGKLERWRDGEMPQYLNKTTSKWIRLGDTAHGYGFTDDATGKWSECWDDDARPTGYAGLLKRSE